MKIRMIGLALLFVTATIATSFAAPSHQADAATCTKYVYRQSGTGTCVKYIQKLVNYHNRSPRYSSYKLSIDGSFGPKTKAAVLNVQKMYQIKRDGIVGPQTWRIICSPQIGPGIPSKFPLKEPRAGDCNI